MYSHIHMSKKGLVSLTMPATSSVLVDMRRHVKFTGLKAHLQWSCWGNVQLTIETILHLSVKVVFILLCTPLAANVQQPCGCCWWSGWRTWAALALALLASCRWRWWWRCGHASTTGRCESHQETSLCKCSWRHSAKQSKGWVEIQHRAPSPSYALCTLPAVCIILLPKCNFRCELCAWFRGLPRVWGLEVMAKMGHQLIKHEHVI